MAEQQSPSVEIAPTVIISNSDEENNDGLGNDNSEAASSATAENSGNSDEPSSGLEQSGTGEFSPHHSGQSEDNSSPIVAVAEIEAGRDIALAEIHDETERERLRLEAERIAVQEERNEEFDKCQREIQELRERVETLTALIQPLPLEAATEEQLEIVPETNLTEPSTAAPIVETLTEPSEESEEERPVAVEEIPARGRMFIAI